MPQHDTILLELQYLPPVQYWAKLVQYPNVWLERSEHYVKGSYRNRCHIAGVNGPLRLSIPLQKGKNEQQSIQEVAIAYETPWNSQHWTSIRSAYGNAPFWDFYADELEPVFKDKKSLLFDYNRALFSTIKDLLQIDTNISFTDTYHSPSPPNVLDFRNAIHPKPRRAKPDADFMAIPYPQVFEEKHGFLENLSVLDLLFCCGPEAVLKLEGMVK